MVTLTKSIELSLSDILEAIDLLPLDELKMVYDHLFDEKTGIKLLPYNSISKTINLEKMIKEKNYQGVNWQKIDSIVRGIDLQEPLEDLLKQLYLQRIMTLII